MPNNRTFYACKGLAVKKTGATPGSGVLTQADSGANPSNKWEVPYGVQSVSVSTAYNLEQVFQQGQLSIYQNIENIPDVEVTINRVLDGTMPLYLIASDESGLTGGTSTLSRRTNSYQCDIALHIYPETVTRASGTADSKMYCSGMYMSAITYTFPVDGNATEELKFVGNNKFWNVAAGGSAKDNTFPSGGTTSMFPSDTDAATVGPTSTKGVTRRQHFNLSSSTLPTDIPTNDKTKIQTVTVSTDLGREALFALGSRDAFSRPAQFPIEITSTWECITSAGDKIQAIAATTNLTNRTIIIVTDQGLTLNLGTANKLSTIDFSGGDTSGGNVTVTYTYTTFNDLTISHTGYAH